MGDLRAPWRTLTNLREPWRTSLGYFQHLPRLQHPQNVRVPLCQSTRSNRIARVSALQESQQLRRPRHPCIILRVPERQHSGNRIATAPALEQPHPRRIPSQNAFFYVFIISIENCMKISFFCFGDAPGMCRETLELPWATPETPRNF